MLPLAHIYVSTKVTNRNTPLLVLGSVLPDVSWAPGSAVGKEQIHSTPNELFDYISKNCFALLDLAVGVKLHSGVDKGADYYSDGDSFNGFAYKEGKSIETDVEKLLGESSIKSKILAHNFIEAGMDLLLLEEYPELLKLYKNSIVQVELKYISEKLSLYLELETSLIEKEINNFLNFSGPNAYKTIKGFMEITMFIIKKRTGRKVAYKEVANILSKAQDIMRDKYKNYLDKTIEHMKVDFAGIIQP